MPRTASTRSTRRVPLQGRPLPSGAKSEPSVPVLFRFPYIDSSADDPGLEAEAPTPLQATVPATTTKQDDASPVVHTSSPQPEAAVSNDHQPQEVEAAATGSWWEHWSSGIVLILLIIALVAASIIAFNDAGDADPALLADAESTDEFALGEISLPNVDLSQASVTTPNASVPSVDESPSAAPLSPNHESQSQVSGTLQLSAGNDSAAGSDSSDSLIPSTLLPGTLEFPGDDSVSQSSDAETSHDLVNLSPGESPTAGNESNAASQTANVVPNSDAHTPGLLGAQNPASLQNNATLMAPEGTQRQDLFGDQAVAESDSVPNSAAGSSPTFYDGAQSPGQGLPGNTTANTSVAQGPTGVPSTNLPDLQSVLSQGQTGAVPYQPVADSRSNSASFSTASHQSSQSEAATKPVLGTDTPNMDTDSIINAWQTFRALQASESGASNRYSTPR